MTKRMDACALALALVLLPVSSLAQALNSYERSPSFIGKITANEIVNKTCIVKAQKPGKLVPNADMNVLSSLLPGGQPGKISVTTGNIEIKLSTKSDRLLKGDGDEAAEVEDVLLITGFGSMNVDTAKEIFDGGLPEQEGADKITAIDKYAESPPTEKNATTEYEVYFVASLPEVDPNLVSGDVGPKAGPGFFLPDTYKGVTTVTCEPRL